MEPARSVAPKYFASASPVSLSARGAGGVPLQEEITTFKVHENRVKLEKVGKFCAGVP